jgi:hypothetical protein
MYLEKSKRQVVRLMVSTAVADVDADADADLL